MILSILAGLLATNTAKADIVFYVNDQTGFEAATSGLTLLGTEDFESSTLGSGQIGRIDDPLAPGIANGPMPFGTKANLGLTLQSNTLSGNASVTSPLVRWAWPPTRMVSDRVPLIN